MRRAAPLLGALWLTACGGSHSGEGGAAGASDPSTSTTQALSVHAVAWNPGNLDVGMVTSVAELDGNVAVLSDHGALTVSGGTLAASDPTVTTWRSAATIPAADTAGSWVVGIDGNGHVQHYRALTTLEDVSDRYGLAMDDVQGVSSLGDGLVAFSLSTGVALADGTSVTRYDDAALTRLAGGGGKAAGFAADGVHVLDAKKQTLTVFPLAGVVGVAVAPDGHVFAITAHALYEEANGSLTLRWEAGAATLRGLVAASARAWMAADGDLVTLDAGVVSRATGAGLDPSSALVASSTGDLWAIAAGKLTRFGIGGPPTADEADWEMNVLPVFARTCGQCHAPGGTSGIDLSTYDSWQQRRALIDKRVVTDRSMPPAGTPISDADRAIVGAWASGANTGAGGASGSGGSGGAGGM